MEKKRFPDEKTHNATWRLWCYFVGSMFTQIGTNATQVIGPLVLLKIASSGFMSLIFGLSAGTDAFGTLFGSAILKHCAPNTALILLHICRIACNLVVVLLLEFNSLNKFNGGLLILADNFCLGMYDTVRALLPVVWTDNSDNKEMSLHKKLKQFNKFSQFMFELGTLIGPLIIGFILKTTNDNYDMALWCTIIAFIFACVFNIFIPGKTSPVPESNHNFKQAITEVVHSDNLLMKRCYFIMILLQIYRAKSTLPALVASSILNSPSSTAWITSMWGVSGMVGSILFENLETNSFVPTLRIDAVALLLFAIAWKAYDLYIYSLAVLFYITIDSVVRLQVQTHLQAEITINSLDASIMSTNRFFCKIHALFIRLAISACFFASDTSELPFWLSSGFLALCSIATLALSKWCQQKEEIGAIVHSAMPECFLDTAPHKYPGYLFVFEGLDGSGKSTQIMLLMKWLKEQYPDRKINLTTWNSSSLLSKTIRHLKQECLLSNAHSFALLQCADLMERLNRLIIPALEHGDIVLCDRYVFTALARDTVRGCDLDWETQLYRYPFRGSYSHKSLLVWPDAVLYFRVPVHTAISRVYARAAVKVNRKRIPSNSMFHQDQADSEMENDSDECETSAEDETHFNGNDNYMNQQEHTKDLNSPDTLLIRRINSKLSYDNTHGATIIDLNRIPPLNGNEMSPLLDRENKQDDNHQRHNKSSSRSVEDPARKHQQNPGGPAPSSVIHVSYYEAGLDLQLHPDFNINFHYFQHRVQNVYLQLYEQYSFTNTFHLFDGELDKQTLFESVKATINSTIQRRHFQRMLSFTNTEPTAVQDLESHNKLSILASRDRYDSTQMKPMHTYLKCPIQFHQINNDKLFQLHKASDNGKSSGAALHFYSRFLTLELQKRFVSIWESLTHESIFDSNHIKSYLHGNPHLDNCVLSDGDECGAFLLDFDRSRIGPISWDITRLLLSVQIAFNTKAINIYEKKSSLYAKSDLTDWNDVHDCKILPVRLPIKIKNTNSNKDLKTNRFPLVWSQAFQRGYFDGIHAQEHLKIIPYSLKRLIKLKKKHFQLPQYLIAARSHPVSMDEILSDRSSSHYILQLLKQYLSTQSAQQAGLTCDLSQISIIELGRAYSTQQRERIIIILQYNNKVYDLEFKLMLHDVDENGFQHPDSIDPFEDGQRFLLSYQYYLSKDSVHQLLYPASCRGPNFSSYLAFVHEIRSVKQQFYSRNHSLFKFRIGFNLTHLDSIQVQELLYLLAHQLGYAHSKYLRTNTDPSQIDYRLMLYIKRYWNETITTVLQLQTDIMQSYQTFIEQQQYHLK